MQALPFIAAGASLLKGVGGVVAGNENGKRLDSAAREKRRAAASQGARVRTDARRKHGELLAGLAGGGLMQALESEAKSERRRGKFALLEGVLGAGSSFIGMKSDWAQARSGDSG